MKNSLLVLAVAVVVATAGYLGFLPSKESPRPLGAVSTLDGVDNPFVSINGKKEAWVSQPIVATSSVLCSITNPFGATTTVEDVGIEVFSSGLGAVTFDISTSSLSYGSSTPAFAADIALGAAAQLSYNLLKNTATTTLSLAGVKPNELLGRTATGKDNYVVGPSELLTFRIATATPSVHTSYAAGVCSAKFLR